MSRYRVGKRPELNRLLGSRDRVPPADAVTRGLKDGGTPWDVRWQGPPFPDDRVNFDSHARIKDMDIEGVDVNMVLPSGGLAAFAGLDEGIGHSKRRPRLLGSGLEHEADLQRNDRQPQGVHAG